MVVLVGRTDGIWRSIDAGRTFDSVDENIQVSEFAWNGVNEVVASTSSGLVISQDGGASWRPCEGVGRDFSVYGVTHEAGSGWWRAEVE